MTRDKFFMLLCLIALGHSAKAQLGLKLSQFRPTGELGQVMDRKVSAELLYLPEFDDRVRSRFFLSYYKLEPRLSSFPITGYEYRDGVWTVYPGTQTFSKYNLMFFGGGMDYALLQFLDERLTFYPGGDIYMGGANMAYVSDVPGINRSEFEGGFMLAGVRARLGVDYALTDALGVCFEYATATYWMQENGRFTFNDIGLGARYTF
jgi:hypothetical protein